MAVRCIWVKTIAGMQVSCVILVKNLVLKLTILETNERIAYHSNEDRTFTVPKNIGAKHQNYCGGIEVILLEYEIMKGLTEHTF
jgi:hypothetical protein